MTKIIVTLKDGTTKEYINKIEERESTYHSYLVEDRVLTIYEGTAQGLGSQQLESRLTQGDNFWLRIASFTEWKKVEKLDE